MSRISSTSGLRRPASSYVSSSDDTTAADDSSSSSPSSPSRERSYSFDKSSFDKSPSSTSAVRLGGTSPIKMEDSSGVSGAGGSSNSSGGANGQPSVTGGSSDEQSTILQDHQQAVGMMDNAIATLQSAKTTPNDTVAQYFGIKGTSSEDQAALDKLIGNFQSMKQDAASPGYSIEGPMEGDASAVAYTTPGSGPIHLMESNVNSADEPAVMVHELSHYYAGTDDLAYDWDSKFSSLSPGDQQKNADSYSGFAAAASGGGGGGGGGPTGANGADKGGSNEDW